VCGKEVPIKGTIKAIAITIKDIYLMCSPVVTENNKGFIIIKADVIVKHPELLVKITDTFSARNGKSKMVRLHQEKKEGIVKTYENLFKTEISEFELCTAGKHAIETCSDKPIYQRNGRIPIHYEKLIDEEVKKNLKLGIIQESKSPWCSRVVPIVKKDGTLRLCIDYQALNSVTIKDKYPIPRIDEIFDALAGSRVFTILDATSGYYQLAVEECDKNKTAFAWKGGLYEFNRMPFGLCNGPATFQRAMDSIFAKERGKFIMPFMDDLIIFSANETEHKKHLDIIFGRIKANGLSLNRKKCTFFETEIKILGNIISSGRIRPDPEKFE
jgi:hypothetical protein